MEADQPQRNARRDGQTPRVLLPSWLVGGFVGLFVLLVIASTVYVRLHPHQAMYIVSAQRLEILPGPLRIQAAGREIGNSNASTFEMEIAGRPYYVLRLRGSTPALGAVRNAEVASSILAPSTNKSD